MRVSIEHDLGSRRWDRVCGRIRAGAISVREGGQSCNLIRPGNRGVYVSIYSMQYHTIAQSDCRTFYVATKPALALRELPAYTRK